jgi:two-component system, NtrC family, sensor kinase
MNQFSMLSTRVSRSLTQKTMLWLGLPIIAVSGVAIGVGYQQAFYNAEIEVKAQLRNYLGERVKRESQTFLTAQHNHAILKQHLLKRLDEVRSQDPEPQFSALIHSWSDGTRRSLPQYHPMREFDQQHEAGVFIGKGVHLTPKLKQEVLVFQALAGRYGRAWSANFVDTWINSSDNISAVYWNGNPRAFQASSETDITEAEYSQLAQKEHNPDRRSRWTGLYFDAVPKQWMVSLVTPVDDVEGNHIASIGNDIILNDLMKRTEDDRFAGTHNLIISQQGRVIVDGRRTPEILEAKGSFKIQTSQDDQLKHILDRAQNLKDDIEMTISPDRKSLISIVAIGGTDWFFVNLYPLALLDKIALQQIIPTIALALVALLAEVGLIYGVLRRQVSQPLGQLLDASQQISEGQFAVKLPTDRRDEVGQLSRSFSHMAQQLQCSFEILGHQNETLESQVLERTQKLTQALTDLQMTQAQLIQNEKMSCLGQMVAGIAHEINNPVNFIHGNLNFAANYIQDLLAHLRLYQQKVSLVAIEEHAETIDLEFLETDLLKIMTSMKVGTDRIRDIVLGLRNFSRLDEADFKFADIHAGIESTLLILGHRLVPLRKPIVLDKQYGHLIPIECYPSQLNQVLMNLLSNSIDALESTLEQGERPSTWKPQISIITQQNATQVEIRIQDNGLGMSEEVRSHIFDPFFTTKEIGKGTGLGLSISHQIIVERHQGTIDCESIPNQGTTFVIRLPIQQSERLPSEPPALVLA